MAGATPHKYLSQENQEPIVMNDEKDAFDLWWEWADKPVDNKPTIDAAVYDAVMALPPDERRDRAKVNAAVRVSDLARYVLGGKGENGHASKKT
jgi:hypothetical protein